MSGKALIGTYLYFNIDYVFCFLINFTNSV